MYKSALGALALSLSIGLVANIASAQTPAATSASSSGSSSTDGVQTYGNQSGSPAATSSPATPTKTAVATPKTGVSKNATTSTSSTTAQAATAPTKKRAADEMVVVQKSKPMASTKLAWQTFEDYITLKQTQDQVPLNMTVTNGGYQSLVFTLNGSKLATEKDFKTTTLTMQMAGALAVGDNKFVIQGYGKPGSKISWVLESPRPVITDIQPSTKGAVDKVTITGRNFAKTAAGDTVAIGNGTLKDSKMATVISGDSKRISIQLPSGVSGKQKVIVSAGTIPSKPFDFEVKAAATVTGVDFVSAPPGQALQIYGTGFATPASENKVTIGGVPAAVSSGSATTLSVTVPEMYYPQWNVPVVVKIGTVESNKNIMLNIQSRVIPNNGAGEL